MNEQRPQPPVRRAARPSRQRPAPEAQATPEVSAVTNERSESPTNEERHDRPEGITDERSESHGAQRVPRSNRRARRAPRVEQPAPAQQPAPQQPQPAEQLKPQPTQTQQPQQALPQDVGPQTRGLTLLGAKTTVYSDKYTPAVLETFDNRHRENDYWVKFNCPEFTSLCPITGQPDFATIYISYIPDQKMVESKSLKLYLFGFRNHGAFHEDCVNIIMKDLIKLMSPRYIEVWGKFLPRGGISIDPFANYGRPTTRWEEFARQRLLMHDLTPERVDNR